MIIDLQSKQLQIESRDVNYILPAYIRNYLYASKNEDPKSIVFPMFSSVPHPYKAGVRIPVEWIPGTDPVAVAIAKDGAVVPEVTTAQEAALDEKDDIIRQLREENQQLRTTNYVGGEGSVVRGGAQADTPSQPAREGENKVDSKVDTKTSPAPVRPTRTPRMPPGGDLGPGLSPSDMQSRDTTDLAATRAALRDEPEIDDSKEKPFTKKLKRDAEGIPVIEE